MKIALSLFALAILAVPTLAAPRLVGKVYPGQTPTVWLGGAYFPGQGWRNDAQSKAALWPGTRWQLFGLEGAGPQLASDKGQINDVPAGYIAPLRGAVAGQKPMVAIAGATSAAQPRRPRAQNLQQPLYQSAVAALLQKQGVNVKTPRLTQLLRVDLDGDGADEVLMAASSRDDYGHTPEARRGDYSLLALRYVSEGRVKTQVLSASVATQAVEFGAPGYFEIMACVDVDGDGTLEIVGANGYYEGDGLEVWKFNGKSARSVISAGWGV